MFFFFLLFTLLHVYHWPQEVAFTLSQSQSVSQSDLLQFVQSFLAFSSPLLPSWPWWGYPVGGKRKKKSVRLLNSVYTYCTVCTWLITSKESTGKINDTSYPDVALAVDDELNWWAELDEDQPFLKETSPKRRRREF